ncbi:MAG: hypothetical protein ACOC2W_02445, partial [bacterium]
MKRLIKKSIVIDDYIGQHIEIVNNDSKFYGLNGWIEEETKEGRLKIFLYSPEHSKEEYHKMFIPKDDVHEWVRVLN